MSRPYAPRNFSSSASFFRVNGKIRAREVRVIGADGKQLGVLQLTDALNLARTAGVDLVEIAPTATPPVCRIVDFGKFRYEQSKKEKESKKHQHATQVKEVQLSPRIDPHDLSIKVMHAVNFLCEDMKVKVALRFRGREMAHTEFGFDVIKKFIEEIALFGHPDFQPKLIGRSINVMISPLPRNKRAKNPHQTEEESPHPMPHSSDGDGTKPVKIKRSASNDQHASDSEAAFENSPFEKIELSGAPQARSKEAV